MQHYEALEGKVRDLEQRHTRVGWLALFCSVLSGKLGTQKVVDLSLCPLFTAQREFELRQIAQQAETAARLEIEANTNKWRQLLASKVAHGVCPRELSEVPHIFVFFTFCTMPVTSRAE